MKKAGKKPHVNVPSFLPILNPQRAVLNCILTISMVVSGLLGARAQTFEQKSPARGSASNGSFAIGDIEAINLASGNLIYKMPLAALPPGRGGGLSPAVYLNYNSKLYDTGVGRVTRPCNSGNAIVCDPADPSSCESNDLTTMSASWCWERMVSQNRRWTWERIHCWTERFDITPGGPGVSMCSSPANAVVKGHTGGWQYGVFYGFDISRRPDTRVTDPQHPPPPSSFQNGWKTEIVFPDGSSHQLVPAGGSRVEQVFWNTFPWETAQPSEYYTIDGTYLRMSYYPNGTTNTTEDDTWILRFPNGMTVHVDAAGVQTTTDTNGNSFTSRYATLANGNDAIKVVDQFEREIVIEMPAEGAHSVHVKGVGGADLTTTIDWGTTQPRGKKYEAWSGDVPVVRNLNYTSKVVRQITLPTGLRYEFEYNSDKDDAQDPSKTLGWGELSRVTTPTGAFVDYEYSMDSQHGGTTGAEIAEVMESYPTKKRVTYEETYDGQNQTRADTWTYARAGGTGQPPYQTSITAPDGSVTRDYLYSGGLADDGNALSHKTVLPDGTTIQREWAQNRPPGITLYQANPYVKSEYTTVPDASGNPSLTSVKDLSYDKNGNVTNIKEYDYLPFSAFTSDSNGNITGRPAAGEMNTRLKRHTSTAYCNPTPDATDTASNDPDSYWYGGSASIKTAPSATVAFAPDGEPIGRAETLYDGATTLGTITVGNPTTIKSWDSYRNGIFRPFSDPLSSNNSTSVTTQYDQYGNVVKVWDASGDSSSFVETTYDSNHHLFPVKVTTPAPDPSGTHGTSQTSEVNLTFDLYTGQPTSVTDEFGQVTTTDFDAWSRPVRTNPLVVNGSPTGPITERVYGVPDEEGELPADQRFIKTRKQIDTTNWDEATTFTDGLGRAIKTRTKDSQGDVFVETHYDNMGRVDRKTNPYRAGDPIYWSKTRYDIAGRPVESYAPEPLSNLTNAASLGVTSFGTSTVTGHTGTVVTTSDASGRKGRSITNAFGELLRVDEPIAVGGIADADLGTLASPAQPTTYVYDPAGKMVRAAQGGQHRYFKYDSLGRLLRVRQPEQEANTALNLSDQHNATGQWTAGFTHDVVGNILTATDARGVTITNTYDRANRVKIRTYSGENGQATPSVSFFYDGKGLDAEQSPNYAKGKPTKVTSSVSETRNTLFDKFGRLTETRQITGGTTYTSKYTYNFAGALVEEEYPSGRRVKNEFESDGDLSRIFGKANGTAWEQTYANGFTYTPDGRIDKLRLGNGLWEAAKFNTRLQVTEFTLGHSVGDGSAWKLAFEYGELNSDGSVNVAKNTGNIAKQTASFAGLAQPFVQAFKFDPLYRVTEARETVNSSQTWKQTYGYDRFGNRNAFYQKVGASELAIDSVTLPAVDAATNRFAAGQGYSYDKTGNVINDPTDAGRSFIFNGDNKQTEVKNSQNVTIGRYYYDGEGKRVKKVTDTETTIFVYAAGKLIAEYSTAAPTANPTTSYTMTDQLGSPRVLTNSFGEVVSRRDFMPFGEELPADDQYRTAARKFAGAGGDSVRKRFTGYEKDVETGLDFAEARYYDNRHARFTAVDPLIASGKSANPQTFNRYAYVMNNPLVLTDPTGLQAASSPNNYRGPVFMNAAGNFSNVKSDEYNQRFTGTTAEYATMGGRNFMVTKNGWKEIGIPPPSIPASPPVVPDDYYYSVSPGTFRLAMAITKAAAVTGNSWREFDRFLNDPQIQFALNASGVGPVFRAEAGMLNLSDDVLRTFGAADDGVMLYRGIPRNHPGYKDALKGIALPRGGTATPLEHSTSGKTGTKSIFTSWSLDYDVAALVAEKSSRPGIVLHKKFQPSEMKIMWYSEYWHFEYEVLITGPVFGAQPKPVVPVR